MGVSGSGCGKYKRFDFLLSSYSNNNFAKSDILNYFLHVYEYTSRKIKPPKACQACESNSQMARLGIKRGISMHVSGIVSNIIQKY